MKYDSKTKRRGRGNPNWKGGRSLDGRGYYRIWVDDNDFFFPMARKDGYIPEHRLVMAKHLGRCLTRGEIVHHKNGLRTDNRLSNLEVLTRLTHALSYKTAYAEGFKAGVVTRDNKLEKQIKLLQWQVTELSQALQLKLKEFEK